MTHWLVYHNPDVMGGPPKIEVPPSVVTNQRTSAGPGDTVYLITGVGHPRVYTLVCRFTVARLGPPRGRWDYQFVGRNPQWFGPKAELNHHKWFDRLRRANGNFAFGMRRITSQEALEGLDSCVSRFAR